MTGGSRGIGAAIASRFAAGGTASRICPAGEWRTRWAFVGLRRHRLESVELAVKQAVEENGPIDVLIANAGITDDKLMLAWARSRSLRCSTRTSQAPIAL